MLFVVSTLQKTTFNIYLHESKHLKTEAVENRGKTTRF